MTSGLKKVDPSQMTHKNPALRESSAVPEKKTPPVVKAKPGALTPGMSQSAAKKPARTELQDGNKWIVVSIIHTLDPRGRLKERVAGVPRRQQIDHYKRDRAVSYCAHLQLQQLRDSDRGQDQRRGHG